MGVNSASLCYLIGMIAVNLSAAHYDIAALKSTICVFCKEEIIHKQSVVEGEFFYVLLDYEPRFKAHELSQAEWAELSTIIPKIVKVFSYVLSTG